jgi:peptide deformylase
VPDQYAEVMRPDRLQHEMDHLEGVLFIDHLSKLKRDMVLKKLAKARKERNLRAA